MDGSETVLRFRTMSGRMGWDMWLLFSNYVHYGNKAREVTSLLIIKKILSGDIIAVCGFIHLYEKHSSALETFL